VFTARYELFYKCSSGEFCCFGCAVAQAVIHRSHSAEARVRSESSPCAICEEQSGTGTSTLVFPVSVIPPFLHTHLQSRVVDKPTKPWNLLKNSAIPEVRPLDSKCFNFLQSLKG